LGAGAIRCGLYSGARQNARNATAVSRWVSLKVCLSAYLCTPAPRCRTMTNRLGMVAAKRDEAVFAFDALDRIEMALAEKPTLVVHTSKRRG
jgi:hypothetical protein